MALTGTEASLVGREAELSRLRELAAPPHADSRLLLLLGDPGAGKTVLSAEAARVSRSPGARAAPLLAAAADSPNLTAAPAPVVPRGL